MNSAETLSKVPGYLFATTEKGIRSYSANGARQSFGVADELPVTVNTKFDLASLTKIVGTTASLLHLIDLGELQVTDLASKYLEPWQGTDKSEITIAELLSHQSGLAEWYPLYFTDNFEQTIVEQIALKSSFGSSYSPLKVWLLMLIDGWKMAPMLLSRSRSPSIAVPLRSLICAASVLMHLL